MIYPGVKPKVKIVISFHYLFNTFVKNFHSFLHRKPHLRVKEPVSIA